MSEKSGNILKRTDLENLFKDGNIPKEADFKSLIDSMINIIDDGFSKTDKNGFEIKLTDQNYQRFISFFKDRNDFDIFFSVEKSPDSSCIILKPGTPDDDGISVNDKKNETPLKPGTTDADTKRVKGFYFGTDGSLGIGKKAESPSSLDVNGFVGMVGRVGTYKPQGQVEQAIADGKWHTIIPKLDNCNGFEIIARVGIIGTGKFAMMHAVALATFGRSKGRIRKTSSHYGFFWNKLTLRWKAIDTHNYALQIKTRSNYGNNAVISYKITKLWDDEAFNEKTYPKK